MPHLKGKECRLANPFKIRTSLSRYVSRREFALVVTRLYCLWLLSRDDLLPLVALTEVK